MYEEEVIGTQVKSENGGTEGANELSPMGKGGVMVLEGGRVLARGTWFCT